MRRPTITAPRLIALIAAAVVLGVAIALPGLLDGDSASETSAVEIGEQRSRGEPADKRNGEREGGSDARERRNMKGPDSPRKGDRAAAPGSTTEGGASPPVAAAPAPAGSAGSSVGSTGGSGGGSGGGAPPPVAAAPPPPAPPPAVAPTPDDDVEDDDDTEDVESDRAFELDRGA